MGALRLRHCGELHVDAACVYLQYSCACRVLLRAGERRCFMHPHLMAVCLMWRYGGVQRYAISDTKASAIIKKLDELGISTKKISKTLTAQIGATSEKRPSRPSFSGHACFAVLAAFEDFLRQAVGQRHPRRGDGLGVHPLPGAHQEGAPCAAGEHHVSGEGDAIGNSIVRRR